MNVLGLSCFYHDAAAALIVDGELIAAAEEERFSRIKHDFEFPERAIRFCLGVAGIQPQDLDLVVFYEKPFQKFDRILMSIMQTFPRSAGAFREGMLVWLLDKLWVRDVIIERLGIKRDKIAFCPHHMSHAASAFFSSGFEKAAVMTVDGVGEWDTCTRGVAWGNHVELQESMRYPHSLGLLYSAFTAFLGFQVNEGEYKVMGMAPYGKPRFTDLIFDKMVDLRSDGSFALDMKYFAYHYSADTSFTPRLPEALGLRPRTPAESNLLDPDYADLAASIQRTAEVILVRQASHLAKRTGHPNLVMAGGVALNSVANSRILRESGFERMYIQPAAGDGGGALGAALWGTHEVLGLPRKLHMRHAYWGESHSDAAVADFLKTQQFSYLQHDSDDALYEEVVSRLVGGQVVGWMDGRFEWGPRALGHRSILADPRPALMKDVVNARIKFREPFRPFAPSVLAERVEDFFVLPDAMQVDPARFMLLVVPVREERKDELGAITHVDGTARIQAVHREESPRYHGLIHRFGEATGVPVVLNTSFNLRGEPIVNTPAEAWSTFNRSDMDALVMGRFIVSRRGVSESRQFSGAELEKWSHRPTLAAEAKAQPQPDATATAAPTKEASTGGHGLFGMRQDDQAPEPAGTLGQKVGRVLLVLLGCLVGTEILLRLLVPMPNLQISGMYQEKDQRIGLTPGWQGRVHSGEFDVRIAINHQGLRDAPPASPRDPQVAPSPARRHLLVLGDSFTFGCWSAPERAYVSQMAQELGPQVQVVSTGNPNYGTDAEFDLLARRGDEFKPDAVLVAFFTGNDFYDNMVGQQAYTVESGFLTMRDEFTKRLEQYNCVRTPSTTDVPVSMADPSPATGALASPLLPDRGPGPATAPSRSAGFLGLPGLGRGARNILRHTYLYQFISFLAWQKSPPPGGIRPSEPPAWYLKAYSPEMVETVRTTWRYLDGIQEQCKRRNVPMAMLVIPSKFEVYDSDWKLWLQSHPGLQEAWFDREKPRRLVVEWARARGVPCRDLHADFASRTERLYYQGDMHWNDQGHFLAGVKAGEFLKQERILP